MLAFPEDSFLNRTYDLFDFGERSEDEEERVIFEAVGTNIEYELLDYDSCETSSLLSSRCSSSGTPSCSSSPCSSERDYGLETYSLPESFLDIDDPENDFDLDFHSWSSSINRPRHNSQTKRRNHTERKNKCSSQKRQRRKNELESILSCSDCRWSELSSNRQQEVLELLIGMVSQKLGLREQLELIRIICPDADVSPNDKEFFIDFELFDDEKFKGVCNFVKQHLILMTDEEKTISNERLIRRNTRKRQESRNSSQIWKEKRESLEKKVLAKTSRQIKKEKRSGLFKKEQVLLIKETTMSIPEEDEEELDVVG